MAVMARKELSEEPIEQCDCPSCRAYFRQRAEEKIKAYARSIREKWARAEASRCC